MDFEHNKTVLEDYLNYLIYKQVIVEYYLTITGSENWELRINHFVYSRKYCILLGIDLYLFSLKNIKEQIEKCMTLNFRDYLKNNM